MKVAKIGEKLAENYLKSKGYAILSQNKKYRQGEIDIIAFFKETLIFVEVKTRTNDFFGFPESAMDFQKMQRTVLAIERYLAEHNLENNWRIDLIAIEIRGRKAALRHYQGLTF